MQGAVSLELPVPLNPNGLDVLYTSTPASPTIINAEKSLKFRS